MKYTEEQKTKDWNNITHEIISFIKKYEVEEFEILFTKDTESGRVLSTRIKKTPLNK